MYFELQQNSVKVKQGKLLLSYLIDYNNNKDYNNNEPVPAGDIQRR